MWYFGQVVVNFRTQLSAQIQENFERLNGLNYENDWFRRYTVVQ